MQKFHYRISLGISSFSIVIMETLPLSNLDYFV